MRFLSADWFAAVGARDEADTPHTPPAHPDAIHIGYRVTSTPDGDVTYRVGLPSGEIVRDGTGADVAFEMDYETACAIHEGRANAQRCVLEGTVSVSGDTDLLMAHADRLDALATLFAPGREDGGA